MKKILLLTILILLVGFGCQKLTKTEAPIAEPTDTTKNSLANFAFDAPDTEDRAIYTWTENRITESLAGNKNMVKIPAIRNYGWGCKVPSKYCLGLFSGGGCVYVKFTGNDAPIKQYENKCENAAVPEEINKYCLVTWGLEGYFTKKTKEICADPTELEAGASCCSEKDNEYEFYVTKSLPNIDKNNQDYLFKTVK